MLLILPELSCFAMYIAKSKKNRCLCALIRRQYAVALRHVGIHVARAARVDQNGIALLPLFACEGSCGANQPRLRYRIRRAWKADILLPASLNGRRKVLHDTCDVFFGLRIQEAASNLVRVLATQLSR